METTFQHCKKVLEDRIQRLTNKLNSGTLTEGQYKAIQGILYRQLDYLKEGKVY